MGSPVAALAPRRPFFLLNVPRPFHFQDNVPALVTERLWIGSIHAAFNSASMQARGITHVSLWKYFDVSPRQYLRWSLGHKPHKAFDVSCVLNARPIESLSRFARHIKRVFAWFLRVAGKGSL